MAKRKATVNPTVEPGVIYGHYYIRGVELIVPPKKPGTRQRAYVKLPPGLMCVVEALVDGKLVIKQATKCPFADTPWHKDKYPAK